MKKQSGFVTIDTLIYISVYVILSALFIGSLINMGNKRIDAARINNDASEILSATERWHSRELLKRGNGCINKPETPTIAKLRSEGLIKSSVGSDSNYYIDIKYITMSGSLNIVNSSSVTFTFNNINELQRIEPFLKNNSSEYSSVTFTSRLNNFAINHKRLDRNTGCYL